MKVRIALGLEPDLLRRVDEARGDVPRQRFIQRALEAKLGGGYRITGERETVELSEAAKAAVRPYAEKLTPPGAFTEAALEAVGPPKFAEREATSKYCCPVSNCEWMGAGSPIATCPHHNRRVVPRQ